MPFENSLSFKIFTTEYDVVASDAMNLILEQLEKDTAANKVVCDIFNQESQNEGYTCFYHAISIETFLSTFFVDAFCSIYLHDYQNYQGPFLRFPNHNAPATIQALNKKYDIPHRKNNNGRAFDWNKDFQSEVLSVNPSLFSNVHNMGEFTWYYYITNYSVKPPTLEAIFKSIFDQCKLVLEQAKYQQYLSDLTTLHTRLHECARTYLKELRSILPFAELNKSDTGVILQILIPNELVSEIVYPCEANGYYCEFPPIEILKNMREETPATSFSEVMHHIVNHEEQEEAALTRNVSLEYIDQVLHQRLALQGRLLVQPMLLQNKIKTIVHGYGAFFQPELTSSYDLEDSVQQTPDLVKNLFENAQKYTWRVNGIEKKNACQELIKEKNNILVEAKRLFSEILSLGIQSVSPTALETSKVVMGTSQFVFFSKGQVVLTPMGILQLANYQAQNAAPP